MINEELIKAKKVLRRSFVVPPEIDQALTQIQHAQGFSNPSEAFRFCVAFTFKQLQQPLPAAAPAEPLLAMVTKNHTLLRYLLIEVIKTNQGRESLSEDERNYLNRLVNEIKEYYQKMLEKNHEKE